MEDTNSETYIWENLLLPTSLLANKHSGSVPLWASFAA